MVPLAGPSLAMARCPDKFQQPHPAWAAGSGRTLKNIQRLSHILPGEDPDHPLGEDCTDSLLEQLDTWLSISESESGNYKRCLETRERSGRLRRGSRRTEGRGLEERQYPRDYSKLQWQQLELPEERRSVENRLRCTQARSAWLENTNAFR